MGCLLGLFHGYQHVQSKAVNCDCQIIGYRGCFRHVRLTSDDAQAFNINNVPCSQLMLCAEHDWDTRKAHDLLYHLLRL